jgi:signal transduction histidine kinase
MSIPVPTYTWKKVDNDFVLIDYNDAALEITHGQIKTVIGKKLSELYRDKKEIISEMHRCFNEKTSIHREMEYKFQTVDKTLELLTSYAYVPPDLILVHTQDITERKRAERDKIRQARYIAGGFAHEIRNSLFPAKGALSILRKAEEVEERDGEKYEKYRKIADRAVSKAIDTTRLISQFTKMDREYIPEKVSLKHTIDDVIHTNLVKLEKQNIKIEYNDLPDFEVLSNRRQLYMVFNNLLLNSMDALTDTQNPCIFISWGSIDDVVEVVFKDNGTGIPEENLVRVFDAFFSTKPDRGTGIEKDDLPKLFRMDTKFSQEGTSGEKGTGLGLILCQELITRNQGTIHLESEVGRGTTVTIQLPAA